MVSHSLGDKKNKYRHVFDFGTCISASTQLTRRGAVMRCIHGALAHEAVMNCPPPPKKKEVKGN